MWKSKAGVAILFSTFLGVGAAPLFGTRAVAGDLVYTPINPSFGGNAFNSSHLLGLANAQNEPKREDELRKEKEREMMAAERASSANFDRFLQTLQSRLYSSLAQKVSDAILGENAQESGTIQFEDQKVFFQRDDGEIHLRITDMTTGQETVLIVPTL
jgi:curli production assembly/transport component CsgF